MTALNSDRNNGMVRLDYVVCNNGSVRSSYGKFRPDILVGESQAPQLPSRYHVYNRQINLQALCRWCRHIWIIRTLFDNRCVILCSFQPSVRHSESQKYTRPLQEPEKNNFSKYVFRSTDVPNKKLVFTSTLHPQISRPTRETPLPRSSPRRPLLFLQIDTFEPPTRHIDLQLP
jgi:hypothetical protein